MHTLDTHPVVQDDETPDIRAISISQVFTALGKGSADFWRRPSHYLFLVIIYPVVGMAIGVWSAGGNAFPLLYPLATGFALVGPVAALGLYEISRRRAAGLDDSPKYAFGVLRSQAIGAIITIGVMLAAIFAAWIATANAIFTYYLPDFTAAPPLEILAAIFTTPGGRMVLFWGNVIGFAFALLVLVTTAIAFPFLVDRGGSASRAIATSVRAFSANPVPMLVWGAIVAALLFIGSLPLFVGLAIVLPILGHATWHLYRAIVA